MCSEHLLAYSWAITLSFIFLPEAGNTYRHFVYMTGYENSKYNIQKNTDSIVHCRVSVVYSCDSVAEWDLWLGATAHHPESIILHYR